MDAQRVWKYLRHRPPMAWISEIISFGSEENQFSGTCRIDISEDSLFLNDQGKIFGAAAVEFCAQGYGFAQSAYQVHHKVDYSPQKTYLAGVGQSHTSFENWNLQKDSALLVDIKTDKISPPIIMIAGQVRGAESNEVYAQVKLTLYIS